MVKIGKGERGHTRVAVVGVHFGFAFGDFQVGLAADLVEGGFAAGEKLAGVAVAGGDVLVSKEEKYSVLLQRYKR